MANPLHHPTAVAFEGAQASDLQIVLDRVIANKTKLDNRIIGRRALADAPCRQDRTGAALTGQAMDQHRPTIRVGQIDRIQRL
jgi:hypothetical protein